MTDAIAARRGFLFGSAAALVAACAGAREPERAASSGGERAEDAISPAEDLMREHGVVRRVLLAYEEGARRLEAGEPLPLEAIGRGSALVRRFVEDYHERAEEEVLFPRFESAGQQVELVRTLRVQHSRGRELTDVITAASALGARIGDADRALLGAALRAFTRMYHPHAAQEDTVLFPAFRELVGGSAYREIGEQLEEREHTMFGEDGFEDAVREVSEVERALGIEDLSHFTPPA